jgi:hypothetical protein
MVAVPMVRRRAKDSLAAGGTGSSESHGVSWLLRKTSRESLMEKAFLDGLLINRSFGLRCRIYSI